MAGSASRRLGNRRPMRTGSSIQALRCKTQSLHRTAVPQMLFDDFVQVFWLHKSVPNLFRINHDRLPMLALLEAAGLVDPQHAMKLRGPHLVFQKRMKLALAVRAAGRPRRTRLPLVGANEDVAIKFRQLV